MIGKVRVMSRMTLATLIRFERLKDKDYSAVFSERLRETCRCKSRYGRCTWREKGRFSIKLF